MSTTNINGASTAIASEVLRVEVDAAAEVWAGGEIPLVTLVDHVVRQCEEACGEEHVFGSCNCPDAGAVAIAIEQRSQQLKAPKPGARPYNFHGPKGAFIPSRLGEFLRKQTPFATGGQQLYVYAGGVYALGERNLRARVAEILGEKWKKAKADETLAYLMSTAPELWDRPPLDRINLTNGILDLATGELAAHDPAFRSPVQLPVEFDPTATCPAIDAYLADVLDEHTAEVFYEIAGYLLTPDTRQQKAVMLLGPGGNGKSRALDVLTALVGDANAANVPLHALEESRFATAELYGRLANVFGDLDARALKTSSTFKSVVGGDAIQGERKHRDPFSFRPYARMLFSANATPPTHDSSQAYFDRWVILPFERRIRGTQREDRDIAAKLTTPRELSGLLNRALTTVSRVRARGFSTTHATTAAGDRFREEADSVAGFISDRVQPLPDHRITRKATFDAYRAWCEENNRQPVSSHRFVPRLRELLHDQGIGETKYAGTPCWTGFTVEGAQR